MLARIPCTKAVVATCVVVSPNTAVGAVGVPANCGLLVTKAVLAICVVAVPGAAVGVSGTPLNSGLLLTKFSVAN